jgi:hypothetical protein
MMLEENRLISTAGFTPVFRNRVKMDCEQHPKYAPSKWLWHSFHPKDPGAYNLTEAMKTFRSWCICVAQRTNGHGFPVGAVGLTKSKLLHFHILWMHERGRKKVPTYELMRNLWRGRPGDRIPGRGYSENYTYNPDKGGVPYSLDPTRDHFGYIRVSSPFCPGRNKCQNGCVKKHNFNDIVLNLLRPTGNVILSVESQGPEQHTHLHSIMNKEDAV